jgi:hypothetical protein
MFSRVCEHHPSKGVHVAQVAKHHPNPVALCGQQLRGAIWLSKSPVTCIGCGQEVRRLAAAKAAA